MRNRSAQNYPGRAAWHFHHILDRHRRRRRRRHLGGTAPAVCRLCVSSLSATILEEKSTTYNHPVADDPVKDRRIPLHRPERLLVVVYHR